MGEFVSAVVLSALGCIWLGLFITASKRRTVVATRRKTWLAICCNLFAGFGYLLAGYRTKAVIALFTQGLALAIAMTMTAFAASALIVAEVLGGCDLAYQTCDTLLFRIIEWIGPILVLSLVLAMAVPHILDLRDLLKYRRVPLTTDLRVRA